MRRRIAVVAAVVLGTTAAGAGAAVPAGAAVSPGKVTVSPGKTKAAAIGVGEPSVTVRAIDREGKAVAVTASFEPAGSAAAQETLTSAHATKVPGGLYNVAAWVWEPGRKAATLVDREIQIESSQTVTFDARPGKPLRFTVNDSTVAVVGVMAEPFSPATGQMTWWNHSYGPIDGAAVYLVPGPLPSGWDLFLEADLVRHEKDGAASPVEYDLVKILSGSVPANLTFASTRAGLALDHLTIRSFGEGIDSMDFSPRELGQNGSGYGVLPSSGFGQSNVRTPASVNLYLSPGYEWQSVDAASNDDSYGAVPLVAGHRYAQTFNAAVFSPSPLLGPVVDGTTLRLTEVFGNCLLVDPASQGAGSESVGLYPTRPQGWLYQGSRLIAHASGYGANLTAKIPATTQAYTLKFATTRVSADNAPVNGIAKSLTATYAFKAAAGDTSLAADAFWPRMIAQGVTEENAAARGSKTSLPITFDTVDGAIAAHNVAVWASANGGRTWTPLRVAHSGSTWTVSVTNPKAAGYVSLKVSGADAAGFTATVTAINAYAVR
jgi:hypothetical protein